MKQRKREIKISKSLIESKSSYLIDEESIALVGLYGSTKRENYIRKL